jgi:putative ATP-dependent endonuclease of OLD family
MFLKKLRIWNFRSIGSKDDQQPGLEIDFDPHLNLLIGANDSGKTAIIDAIRYCLGTITYDSIRVEVEDFYQNPQTKDRANELKIECTFDEFTDEEAGQFLEWINIDKDKNTHQVIKELRVWFTATNRNNRIITNLKAGIDDEGQFIDGSARDLLRVTYLKPLRDAESELTPGYHSRLYQILRSHPVFEKNDVNDKHPLEKYFEQANKLTIDFFDKDKLEKNLDLDITGEELTGKVIKDSFINQTERFLEKDDKRTPEIKITPAELNAILRKLELSLEDNKAGLGTLNLLYMATELINLRRENYLGLRLALIEELEAHLHPQAQLRVLKSLLADENSKVQYILTTHSTQLGSSIPLKYIKLCFNSNVYSLDSGSTALSEGYYQFLERFLDATKANFFFAKGVMIVEGYAENILIPTLAELLDRPLYKYGVSIVNVGHKELLHYVNIFKRKDGNALPIKVAVVTDLDTKINENGEIVDQNENISKSIEDSQSIYNSNDGNIKAFVSPLKTMEFDIAMGSLYEYIYKAIQIAKKIKSRKDWITDEEVKNIQLQDFSNENDIHKRAQIIYQPLEKNQASKSVTAQWFAKLLNNDKDKVLNLIRRDYTEDTGIKYLIEAIEHVTEKINWEEYAYN